MSNGLYEVKVSGDGNCQLKDYRSLYEGYVPMKYKRYYKKMAKSGEWGDHVTLQAAADKFEAKICLLTSFRDTCFIEIMPQYQPPKRGKMEGSFLFSAHSIRCSSSTEAKEETLVVLGF
ncbi:unnamed protein product [Prunus armeniaca]|uniref:OTU domain-containing protein n=1 Tax=Prunus armeniaca TaxID=36596 RepID=A0A6J5X4A2_PRUAR|nr:unnamed protein product [Prunus armeniaca]